MLKYFYFYPKFFLKEKGDLENQNGYFFLNGTVPKGL